MTFNFLHNHLVQLWKPTRDYSLLELGNDFFLFKCEGDETLNRALTEGPWIVAGNYLIVQRWKLGFSAFKGSITSMSIWVHIPEFLVELYNKDIIFSIGQYIGHPIKLDMNTYWATKDKYARL